MLTPTRMDANAYRRYDSADLLRLQQILFFRELKFPLKQINRILDDPTTNPTDLLKQHYESIGSQITRLQTLQSTIEKTIHKLNEENTMPLTDRELYEGFDQETIDRYQREVRATYDPEMVKIADSNVRSMSKSQWTAVKGEGNAIATGLAALMNRHPSDPEVQALIARQHAWIENFYPVNKEIFQGLGELYTTHAEFRAYYEKSAPCLADFMREAIDFYASEVLD